MKTFKIANLILLAMLIGGLPTIHSGVAQTAQPNAAATMKTSGYAPVNGLKMYYEIHGEGEPLLLLHGSFMTIGLNWTEIIPELAKTHKVIAVEMQGHGHTADIDRPITYQALASDAAALLQYLKIDSADVLGYSLGATIGLEVAIQNPKLVKRLVFISSAYKTEGWTKATRDAIAGMKPEFLTNSPLKTAYDQVAPDKAHWEKFLTRMIEFEQKPFDLGIDNIKKLKIPFLIINGDNDGVEYAHSAELYKAVGGGVFADMQGLPKSQYAVLPAASHVTLMMQTGPLASIIIPFLK